MLIEEKKIPEKGIVVLDAVIHCCGRGGLRQATTAAIARQAGIGEGTIYRYFANKEKLVIAAAYRVAWKLSDFLMERYDEKQTVQEQFSSFCKAFVNFAKLDSSSCKFMEQFFNAPTGVELRKKIWQQMQVNQHVKPFLYPLSEILYRAMKQGLVKGYPFQLLATLVMGQLTFVARDMVAGVIELDESLITAVAQACWDSIRK